jgi:hypothetical protein
MVLWNTNLLLLHVMNNFPAPTEAQYEQYYFHISN